MSKNIAINVEHVTRVEGHGNIVMNANNGKLSKIEWQVSEAPRFFESFVRGRPYNELSHITSRICGICSIGHSLASLKATENALDIPISKQTELLRKIGLHGENMQSHILHVGYLVAPDLFHVGSVFPLVKSAPEIVKKIISLHRLANEMSDLICGRTIHPITLVPGGFSSVPTKKQLLQLKKRLEDSRSIFNDVAGVILDNADKLPNFSRKTEYISLTAKNEYALYDGMLGSTDAKDPIDVADYASVVNEFIVPQSTAKYCKHKRESYMVGALARFNNNASLLHPDAKKWADTFKLKPVSYNPFMNNVAQMIEFIHSVEDSIELIDTVIEVGINHDEKPKRRIKAGRGIGAVEVPRGLLIHDYTYDAKGICTKANCVIPTNQNHNNIQHDMESFAPTLLDLSKKEIELNLEMLVRAYDPCISCSTHYLDVTFVDK